MLLYSNIKNISRWNPKILHVACHNMSQKNATTRPQMSLAMAIQASFSAFSSRFQPIMAKPAYSSLFKPIQTYSKTFKPIQTHSNLEPIPTYTSLFMPIPANYSLLQHISAYYSLLQHIFTNSSLWAELV